MFGGVRIVDREDPMCTGGYIPAAAAPGASELNTRTPLRLPFDFLRVSERRSAIV